KSRIVLLLEVSGSEREAVHCLDTAFLQKRKLTIHCRIAHAQTPKNIANVSSGKLDPAGIFIHIAVFVLEERLVKRNDGAVRSKDDPSPGAGAVWVYRVVP